MLSLTFYQLAQVVLTSCTVVTSFLLLRRCVRRPSGGVVIEQAVYVAQPIRVKLASQKTSCSLGYAQASPHGGVEGPESAVSWHCSGPSGPPACGAQSRCPRRGGEPPQHLTAYFSNKSVYHFNELYSVKTVNKKCCCYGFCSDVVTCSLCCTTRGLVP